LEGMAIIFLLAGRPVSAARMLGGAEAAREKLDLAGLEFELELRAGAVALVQEVLEPEVFVSEHELGRTWALEETIGVALAEAAAVALDSRAAPERHAMVSL